MTHRAIFLAWLGSATLVASVFAFTATAKGYTGENLAPHARVNIATAQAIALKARPGRVKDRELEKEAGGSGMRYSFDIVSAGKTFEVGVDARSGAVLENKAEGPHPD